MRKARNRVHREDGRGGLGRHLSAGTAHAMHPDRQTVREYHGSDRRAVQSVLLSYTSD